MQKGTMNLALKATVEDEEDDDLASHSSITSEALTCALNDHLALAARAFWDNPKWAKGKFDKSGSNNAKPREPTKARTCYNCQDKYHFVAECPYEKREEHGGRLVLKDKHKMPAKKAYVKKKSFNKRTPRIVLMTQEEYPTDEDEDESEEDTPNEVAAIATASTTTSTPRASSSMTRTTSSTTSASPSLFDSPNENKSTRCLMAKTSEVTSSPTTSTHDDGDLDDASSLRIKEELVAFDTFISNLQGETKKHVGALMSRIGELEDLLEEKGKIERDDAISLFHLRSSLQEIEESHARLEEQLDTIEESHNVAHSKIVKDRDMYFAKNKLMQKDKAEFVVGHVRLIEDMEKLVNAHKALESEHSSLKESHAQLQTRLANLEKPSTSTPICACDNANLLKENARLKVELTKASMTKITLLKGKHTVEAPIYKPQSIKGKEGLGYVPPAQVNAKRATPPLAKKITIPNGNATRGKPIRNDFAGDNNPNYALYINYYGNVCARYIGPYDGFINYAIWVPKTLVANKKAPIVKQWVPKVKN
jgi:hypothetical protein